MARSSSSPVAGGEAEAQRDPFRVQHQAGEVRLPRGTGRAYRRVPVPQGAEMGGNQGPGQVCRERGWRSRGPRSPGAGQTGLDGRPHSHLAAVPPSGCIA